MHGHLSSFPIEFPEYRLIGMLKSDDDLFVWFGLVWFLVRMQDDISCTLTSKEKINFWRRLEQTILREIQAIGDYGVYRTFCSVVVDSF